MRGTVGNWWWKPQRIEEYATVTSPYNTYLNPGLPPGPIASPGLSAIEARNPAASDYCFFLATGDDGRHVPAPWQSMNRTCASTAIDRRLPRRLGRIATALLVMLFTGTGCTAVRPSPRSA